MSGRTAKPGVSRDWPWLVGLHEDDVGGGETAAAALSFPNDSNYRFGNRFFLLFGSQFKGNS
ncbi:MAG: hypothetical protein J2P54_18500, partial [Bradyrhizobiaceae bacterium]|nr:hypothetical protein [Bradyrhizobiaceae bacterium]